MKTETRCGAEVVVCESCGRFCSASGGVIVHANYCDGGKRSERIWPLAAAAAPVAAPVADAATPAELEIGKSVPLNAVGNGGAEDEWHRVNSRNPKDWDRAMNRDD